MALILDTGPLYASLDRSDADHGACRALIEEAQEPLVIPAPVLVEVDHWIHARMHAAVLGALLDDIVSGAYRVENVTADDYPRIRELCYRYADSDIGFVDAAVLDGRMLELTRFRGRLLSLVERKEAAMAKARRYPPEFRRRMIELVRTGRTPEELGREFEPSAQTIRNWVRQEDLEVSTSGYYGWLKREPSARSMRDLELAERVKRSHERSKGTYGRLASTRT